MGLDKSTDLESIFFNYIDELKFLFFPNQWSSVFLDYSKNEILALLFLYRYKTANMTEISEYINAPLNTTTGVVGRLEKKSMVDRVRSDEDRRIVQIVLTDKAKEFINSEKEIIEYYFRKLYDSLTDEEKNAAFSIFRKVADVLHRGMDDKDTADTVTKKVKKITIE